MSRITDWTATLQELGESFLGVLKAELEAFKADLMGSARMAARAMQLFALAFLLLFWLIGLLLAAVVALLGRSVGYWQAAFLVAIVLLAMAIGLWLWARAMMRRVQGPKATAREHIDDHVAWVKSELAGDEPATGGDDEPSGA
jgi:Flp pilus assembly protein TadB